MGTKKQWTGQEKLAIVLQGLKGECILIPSIIPFLRKIPDHLSLKLF